MGDEPPKPHFGRFGTGGQLRVSLQFVPNGASAKRRSIRHNTSDWSLRSINEEVLLKEEIKSRNNERKRRRKKWRESEKIRLTLKEEEDVGWEEEEEEEGVAERKFETQLYKDVPEPYENDRPVSLEHLIACMQSEAPGESAIALSTFQQLW